MCGLLIAVLLCQAEPNVSRDDFARYMATTAKRKADDRARALRPDLEHAKRGLIDRRVAAPSLGGRDEGTGRIVGAARFPNQTMKREFIATLEKRIADERSPAPPELMATRMAVGQVGRLRGLIRLGDSDTAAKNLTVASVVDSETLLGSIGTARPVRLVLIKPTAGLVDGSRVDMTGDCWEVTGTTMIGGETLFELRPFDWREYLKQHK